MIFNIMVQFIQKLRQVWSTISWAFSVESEIEYIQHELAAMNAFLEEAEDVPERAKIKGQWIRRVRGLACDVEDCFDEFRRRLLQPTDQEVISCFLRIGVLLGTWADTYFLKTSTWFLSTSGTCFRRVGTCFNSTVVGTSFHATGARFLRTGVELALVLAFAVLALAFAASALSFAVLALAFAELALGFSVLALALLLGPWCLRTSTGTCFRGVGTSFRRVGTSFRTTGARFLRTGVELDAPLLRTGVERGILLLKTGSRLLRMGHAYFWLVVDIARIKVGVKEAYNTAQRFGFISMPSNAIPAAAAAAAGSLTQQLNAHFNDANVEIKKPRDELLKLLLDGDKEETCVISVVGCGGLGKTTLARKVFESQKLIDGGRFGLCACRAWFVVSQSFQLTGFLKQVFLELSLDGFNQELRPDQLIRKIRNHLQHKRYVIVFDDVWTVVAWEDIKHVFPPNSKGSRVIVTTRDENVASTCCVPDYEHVYKLPTLSPKQSMKLFCKIVFDGHPCPNYLKFLSEKILKKCGGVPLVIKTLGGVLARKPAMDVDDWKDMLRDLGSGLRNNPNLIQMMQIMAISYNALPNYHLKLCFLYLSIYPEDYEIDCKQLQALWIAERFVGEEDAESYLNEFVCRNMIQACKISDRGRVRSCRVHDVMLEFIISKSTQHNLVTLGRSHGAASSQAEVRRLSLHPSDIPGFPFENTRSDHLRSFFVFGDDPCGLPPRDLQKLLSFIWRSSRFLRVVELTNLGWLTDSHLHEIGKLYHLKHLKLRNCRIDCIPETFGGLENLETLDVGGSFITIPAAVYKLPKLRHLTGRKLYPSQGLGSSKTLQTLDRLWCRGGGELQELRSLTQLRKLVVVGLRPEQWMDLCDSISGMCNYLRSLKVELEFKAVDAMDYLDSLASPPVHLRSLELRGYLGRLPGWINMLQEVSKIILYESELQFDAIQALQKLPNLVTLRLLYKSYIGKELHFDGEGFGRLKTLYLEEIHSVESLAFGAGSMPSLQMLHIYDCQPLDEVCKFDRENLPRLNKVVIGGMQTHKRQQMREIAEAHPNNPTIIALLKQKVVIMVQMEDSKKRAKALKAVVAQPGVLSAKVDGEKIVVVGDEIDAVGLMRLLRKKIGYADLPSVGRG